MWTHANPAILHAIAASEEILISAQLVRAILSDQILDHHLVALLAVLMENTTTTEFACLAILLV
jgi:hypothetical protein